MLLVDANVLLHALNRGARQHESADGWLRAALGGREPVAFAWAVLLTVLRIATHPAVFPRPLDPVRATEALEVWLQAAPSVTVEPTGRHLALVRGLLADAGTAGNLVADAHLAALALEHRASVVSYDRDFERFPGLRVVRPG